MARLRLVQGFGRGIARAFRHLALLLLLLCAGCLVQGEGGRGPPPTLEVTSGAFPPGGQIPVAFTCDGANISPPISWSAVPQGTAAIALLFTDPDAPSGTFVHWVVYNIPPGTGGLSAGTPGGNILPAGSLQGTNDMGRAGYGGPCPPGGKPHHYHFTVYALDTPLNLPGTRDGRMLEGAMAGHILARGEITGLYQRA